MRRNPCAYFFVGIFGIVVFVILMLRDFVFVSDPTLLLLQLIAYFPYFILLAVSIIFIMIGLYKLRVMRKEDSWTA